MAENSVLQVSRSVLAPIRDSRFESIAQLNAKIAELVGELNERPFTQRPGSRKEVFEALDLPALQPLPMLPYCHVEIRVAKVAADYHVHYRKCWYSVPHEYVGKRVEVHGGEHTVTFFYNNMQIAQHPRSRGPQQTNVAHMPESHAKWEKWTPDRVARWSSNVGDACHAWTMAQIDGAAHFHCVSRKLLGVLNLAGTYGDRRLEDACDIANRCGMRTYREIKRILDSGADRAAAEQPELKLELPQDHENVRGADHYK